MHANQSTRSRLSNRQGRTVDVPHFQAVFAELEEFGFLPRNVFAPNKRLIEKTTAWIASIRENTATVDATTP
jgi:hypothetical protein